MGSQKKFAGPSAPNITDADPMQAALYLDGGVKLTGANPLPVSDTTSLGAPITGQALEAGGSGLLGWLASLRKAITDRLGTLGQQVMAASTPVVIASNQTAIPVTATAATFATPAGEQLTGTNAAQQMASVACKLVRFKCDPGNSTTAFLGHDNTVTTAGLHALWAGGGGDDTGWIPAANLNEFWYIAASGSPLVYYWTMN